MSPYLKTLSMVAAIKLLHLLEAFSTPWFLFSAPSNHHLVFFLLEIFNNIIQYQFDGKRKVRRTKEIENPFHQPIFFLEKLRRFFNNKLEKKIVEKIIKISWNFRQCKFSVYNNSKASRFPCIGQFAV